MPTTCRCDGTGVYNVEVSLAKAVVLIRRVCLDHLARRTRLKDTTNGRVGEVMDVNTYYKYVHLRPVGGGLEWTVDAGSLEPLSEAA